jgi:hypothetical protein
MANLIRLKQIESSALLESASVIAADFSAAVLEIVTGSVVGSLPAGVISSSAQIILADTTGSLTGSRVVGGTQASSIEYENILNRPTLVSGSSQIISILQPLNQFTSSLDNTFATDAELTVTASNLNIDMGEW